VRAAAREIGQHLRTTASLVEELRRLVQRRSLFKDPAQQISENREVIKRHLNTLNNRLASFVKLATSASEGQGVRTRIV